MAACFCEKSDEDVKNEQKYTYNFGIEESK